MKTLAKILVVLALALAWAAPAVAFKAGREQARTLIVQKKFLEASELLRQVVEEDPRDYEAWRLLGLCLGVRKQYLEAEEAFGQALSQAPDRGRLRARYHGSRGMVRVWARNYAGAKQDLDIALASYPGHQRYTKYHNRALKGLGLQPQAPPGGNSASERGQARESTLIPYRDANVAR